MKHLLFSFALMCSVLAAQAGVEVGKTYRVCSKKYPTKSLFVKNSSLDLSADVVLWTETDVPAQQWTVCETTTEALALKNVHSGYYATPRTQNRNGTLRQNRTLSTARLLFEAVDEQAGLYHIMTNQGTFYLKAKTGEDGEAPAWDTKTEDDEGQLWLLEEVQPKTTLTADMRDEFMGQYLKQFCTSKGASLRTFGGGGWGEAEQMEVALDAYESTGNDSYLKAATYVYNYFKNNVGDSWNHLVYTDAYKWYGHDFNDDVMWEVIAVARLGWLTGNQTYVNAAKKNFDLIYERAYIPFTGLMRWAENSGDAYGTNSCIAGPTEVAACYLGMSGCGEEYFEKARDLYAAQRYTLANNMQTGKVWDSVVWDPATQQVKSKNEWASTYNQGTMLGAACLLYDHYGDRKYLSDAQKIMNYTRTDLCDANGLIKVCQDETNGDLCGFKGILMRYVRRYVLDLCQPAYQEWLRRNAMLAYSNRSPQGLTGTGWLTKATEETTKNGFGCSTAASALVNTPLGEVVKNGFDTLQVEHFDYHSGLVVNAASGRGNDATVYVADGRWAKLDNVDFGEETARSVAIDVSSLPGTATGTVEIYFDRMEGTPAGVCRLEGLDADATWHTVLADIEPTTGRHHVFLRFTCSTARSKAYQADQFCFYTETADIVTGVRSAEPETEKGEKGVSRCYDLSGRCLRRPPLHGTFILRQDKASRIVLR